MAAPDNRVPVRVARGTKATLLANIADLYEGEICYATDENICYVKEGAALEPASGGATNLGELSDVDLTTPATDGQTLVWSAVDSAFLPGNPPAAINDLTDVDTTTVAPTDGQALVWSSADSEWQPGAAGAQSINELSDVDTATVAPTDGQVLTWVDADSEWQPETLAGVTDSSIADLNDVTTNVDGDPDYASVSLLLDGTDFVDKSSAGLTIGQTSGGSGVSIYTNDSVFGDSSYRFQDTAIEVDNDPALDLSTGDWTIEFWAKSFLSIGTSTYFFSIGDTSSTGACWSLRWINGLRIMYRAAGSTSNVTLSSTYQNWSSGDWYHIAVVRTGDNIKFFLNGTDITDPAATDLGAGFATDTPTSSTYIGARKSLGSVSGDLNGLIEEFRITKGVARYTSNFSVPTGPYAQTAPVSLLDGQILQWNESAGQWYGTDMPSSSIAWSVTADGTDNYIFSGDGFAGTETDPVLTVVRGQTYEITNSMGAHPFQIQSASGLGGAAYNDGITNNAVSNGTLTWEVRMDAPAELYYQCTAHATMGGTIQVLENAAGGGGGASDIGSLTDVNIASAGEGDILTAVGLPPEEKLILTFDANTVTNSGSSSNLSGPATAVGAAVQSSVWKYGGGALKIDGKSTTPNALINWFANTATSIEGDDFTVEAWILIMADSVANDDAYTILSKRFNATGNNSYAFQYYPTGHTSGNGGKLSFLQGAITADGTQYFSDAINMTASTWHHVAVVKSGTDLTFYFNGIPAGSATGVTNCPNVSNGGVIGNMNADGTLDQVPADFYIDDLSVADVAKYTAGFTPSQNLPYSSLEWTSTDHAIDNLSDVDTTTTAPTDSQALMWSATRSQWEPKSIAAASKLDELSDATVPDLSFTAEFTGRFSSDPGTFPTTSGEYYLQSSQDRIFVMDIDADGQDLFAFYPTQSNSPDVVGKTVRVATDAAFTNILFEFTVDIYSPQTGSNRMYFETNDTSVDVSGPSDGIYFQTGVYTASFSDGSRLAWDATKLQWVPQAPALSNVEVPENPTISILNFDLPDQTGADFDPVPDDYATAVDGFNWSAAYFFNKVVTSPVKFGTGAYELLTGVIRYPDENNGDGHTEEKYEIWAPRWALGASDFTMEFWWYYPSGQNTAERTLVCWGDATNHSAIRWAYLSDGVTDFEVSYTPEGLTTETTATFNLGAAIPEDVWTHVAICREGSNLRAFVNGTQAGATHNIGSTVIKTPEFNSYSTFSLGGNQSNSVNSRGHIDGWRYVKKALYTADFTAPTSAPAAVDYDDGTLLVYSNGAWRPAPSSNYVSVATLKAAVNDGTGDFTAFKAYINAL